MFVRVQSEIPEEAVQLTFPFLSGDMQLFVDTADNFFGTFSFEICDGQRFVDFLDSSIQIRFGFNVFIPMIIHYENRSLIQYLSLKIDEFQGAQIFEFEFQFRNIRGNNGYRIMCIFDQP